MESFIRPGPAPSIAHGKILVSWNQWSLASCYENRAPSGIGWRLPWQTVRPGFAHGHVIRCYRPQNTYKCLKASAFHPFQSSRFSDGIENPCGCAKTKLLSRTYGSSGSSNRSAVANVMRVPSLRETFTLRDRRQQRAMVRTLPGQDAHPECPSRSRQGAPRVNAAPVIRMAGSSGSEKTSPVMSAFALCHLLRVFNAVSMTNRHARHAGTGRDVRASWLNEELTVRFPGRAGRMNHARARKCYFSGTVILNPGV